MKQGNPLVNALRPRDQAIQIEVVLTQRCCTACLCSGAVVLMKSVLEASAAFANACLSDLASCETVTLYKRYTHSKSLADLVTQVLRFPF
jgi:hypothetical protein